MAFPILAAAAAGATLIQGASGFLASRSNARALKGQMRDERAATRDAELDQRAEARKAIGAQLAAQYANGLEGGSGTTLDALRESLVNAAVDAQRIRRDGAGRVEQLRRRRSIEQRSGYMDLAASMIGAASGFERVRSDWAQARVGSNAGVSG